MRLSFEILFAFLALLLIALWAAPGTVLVAAFAMVLWKMWRHHSRVRGVRR